MECQNCRVLVDRSSTRQAKLVVQLNLSAKTLHEALGHGSMSWWQCHDQICVRTAAIVDDRPVPQWAEARQVA